MHQIYALHLGNKSSTRSEFLHRDPSHDPLTISFYFWVVLGGREPLIFDVGFDANHAAARGVQGYRERPAMLDALGVRPAEVRTVVMSHLHWDHWSGYALFANATFLVQSTEVAFWNGPAVRHPLIMYSANQRALEALTNLKVAGRVGVVDGPKELWPGLRIVPLAGHTPGLQGLLVETERGPVMMASDACHFYENYERRRPAQVTMDLPAALDAFDVIHKLAGDDMIAGHDPSDLRRYAEVAPGVHRIA